MVPVPRPKPEPGTWDQLLGFWDRVAEEAIATMAYATQLPAPVVAMVLGGLLIAFALAARTEGATATDQARFRWLLFANAGRARCRWIADDLQAKRGSLRRWVCSECGVDAYTTDKKPPRECKRALRPTTL